MGFFFKYGCRAQTRDNKATIQILFVFKTVFLDLHTTRGEPIEEMVAFPSVSTLLTVKEGFIWVKWEREKETFHKREKVQLGRFRHTEVVVEFKSINVELRKSVL